MGESDFVKELSVIDSFTVSEMVCESECSLQRSKQIGVHYSMIYAIGGRGFIHNKSVISELNIGDVIVAAPYSEWSIENVVGLKYIRIAFFGMDAKALAAKFGLQMAIKQYIGISSLLDLWTSCLKLPRDIASLRCKGIIYLTFSEIMRTAECNSGISDVYGAAYKIKSFIDNNFANSEINLNYISEKLSYHSNYITSAFTKEFHINVVKYINILRIRHACFLMEQGITLIKEVSALCGYENSDYFSSVFKTLMKVTPKMYLKHLRMKSNQEY